MKPLPWSFSSLDTFASCPKRYFEQYIAKSVKEQPTPEMAHGTWVHSQFEKYVESEGTAKLDPTLKVHEPYLQKLTTSYGKKFTELKWGLSRRLEPVNFYSPDVWARGIIDYQRWYATKEPDGRMKESLKLVDYKTGKRHTKDKQLKLFALYGFQTGAQLVDTEYYWTQDPSNPTRRVYSIAERDELWGSFLPDLRQYSESFKTNTWQARPNGLCNGWCPVTTCRHWGPKRVR